MCIYKDTTQMCVSAPELFYMHQTTITFLKLHQREKMSLNECYPDNLKRGTWKVIEKSLEAANCALFSMYSFFISTLFHLDLSHSALFYIILMFSMSTIQRRCNRNYTEEKEIRWILHCDLWLFGIGEKLFILNEKCMHFEAVIVNLGCSEAHNSVNNSDKSLKYDNPHNTRADNRKKHIN